MMSLILENGRATLRLSSLYCCCAREKEVCEEMACKEGGVKRDVCVCGVPCYLLSCIFSFRSSS